MARVTVKLTNPLPGLNTSQHPAKVPLGYFTEFRNVRTGEGTFARRAGMKRVVGSNNCGAGQALIVSPTDLGDDSHVRIPANSSVYTLPTRFTIDITVNPDEMVGTDCEKSYILGFDSDTVQPFSLLWTATNQFLFTLTDANGYSWQLLSADAFDVSDVNTVIPIRIVRDGSYLAMLITTSVQGVVQCSRNDLNAEVGGATASDDLIIGSLDPFGSDAEDAAPFDGVVDEFRVFHTALPDQPHAFTSWHDPRHPALVALYRFNNQGSETDPSPLIYDDSRFANHGTVEGSASFTTGLVYDLDPVVGLHHYRSASGQRQVLMGIGDTLYTSPVT